MASASPKPIATCVRRREPSCQPSRPPNTKKTARSSSPNQRASLLDGRTAHAAAPIGIHLEGPWIHPGAAGAQPRGAIRPFERGEGEEVLERGEGWIRMVTLAPEIEGAPALQAALSGSKR